MRRPFWFRALIAIWGLWLTAGLSEFGGAHACPVHRGHAAHAAASAHDDGMSAAAMEAMQQRASLVSSSTDPSRGHDHSGACTCLGQGCCGTPVAIPAASGEVVTVALVEAPSVEYAELPSPRVDRTYDHPFANGPPARA
ncbi:MAG: hypothetical protein ABJF01_15835 [bacterium]